MMNEKQFRRILIEVRDKLLDEMRRKGFYYRRNKRFDATTWDINNGLCEEFGLAVERKVPGVYCIWLEDYTNEDISHTVVVRRGRYYDAECINGVKDWRDIPVVKNQPKFREQVLRERECAQRIVRLIRGRKR